MPRPLVWLVVAAVTIAVGAGPGVAATAGENGRPSGLPGPTGAAWPTAPARPTGSTTPARPAGSTAPARLTWSTTPVWSVWPAGIGPEPVGPAAAEPGPGQPDRAEPLASGQPPTGADPPVGESDVGPAPLPPPGAGVPAPGAGYAWPLLPVPAVRTPFRAPAHPYGPGHRGVDLEGAAGQPVLAARAGTVVFSGPVAGRGVVSVQHDDGLRTTYEPVRPTVTAGAAVRAGDVLGLLAPGHAGCAPVVCLHWGVRRDRTDYLDPMVLLRPPRVRLLPVPDPWPAAPG